MPTLDTVYGSLHNGLAWSAVCVAFSFTSCPLVLGSAYGFTDCDASRSSLYAKKMDLHSPSLLHWAAFFNLCHCHCALNRGLLKCLKYYYISSNKQEKHFSTSCIICSLITWGKPFHRSLQGPGRVLYYRPDKGTACPSDSQSTA